MLFGRSKQEVRADESRGLFKTAMQEYMGGRGLADPNQQIEEMLMEEAAEEQRRVARAQAEKKVETKFLTSNLAFKSSMTRD